MYRYIDCGLSNVWLTDGYNHKDSGIRKFTVIKDAVGLHRLIAHQLINRRSPLVSSEMRFLRHELNLSRQSLGNQLGVEIAFITHWERSDRRLPRDADVNLRILYATTRLTDCETTLSVHLLADDEYHPSPAPLVFSWSGADWRLNPPTSLP